MRFSSVGICGRLRAAAPALLILPALFSCTPADTGAPAPATPVLHFVASGLCVTGLGGFDEVAEVEIDGEEPAASFRFADGCLHVPCQWSPGETYSLRIAGRGGGAGRSANISACAPQQPGFAVLNVVGLAAHLGDAGSSAGDTGPTACAVSPDGRLCAVGSGDGRLVLFSVPAAEVSAQRYHAGAYIRSLAFAESDRGLLLLVGEQSPRGAFVVYRVGDDGGLRQTWRYRTSNDIGTTLRDPSDPFGWAHTPGIYRILPLPNGEALVLAAHSRGGGSERIERSVLYRFSLASRRAVWRWPRSEPLDAVATWIDTDPAGRTVALCSYRGGDGEGSVLLLEGSNGRLLARHRVSPLRPLLRLVTFWRSLAVSPDGRWVAFATNDGRACLWSPREEALPHPLTLGEPMVLGELPLLISGAGVAATSSAALFITGTTYLPWELTSERVPPEPHPEALKVLAYGWDGRLHGALPVPSLAQGVSLGSGDHWLLLSYSSDPQFSPLGSSGLLAVSLDGPGLSAVASYPLSGGAMHGSPVASRDGRLIVLAERAQRARGGERSIGADRLHFLCW